VAWEMYDTNASGEINVFDEATTELTQVTQLQVYEVYEGLVLHQMGWHHKAMQFES